MARQHVDHGDIVKFAQEKVNLPKDKADEYRAQARRLREKLEGYLDEHPDFTLKKMLLSGSLAKGTALRSLNDIDVACYISGADAPGDVPKLLNYLAERLAQGVPEFQPGPGQAQHLQRHGLLPGNGSRRRRGADPLQRRPGMVRQSRQPGRRLASCEPAFPRHLEFIRKRKKAQETHFAQVVRLVKFWARKMKRERDGFRFKSFMIEMILAHLADQRARFLGLSRGAAALLHLRRPQQFPRADRLRRLLRAVMRRHVHRTGEDHRSGQRQEQRQPLYTDGAGRRDRRCRARCRRRHRRGARGADEAGDGPLLAEGLRLGFQV